MAGSRRETIVLIHGLWEAPLSLKYLGFHLHKAGYEIKYFGYRSMACDLVENAAKLFEFFKKQHDGNIHLVGHSLGGFIVLELLEKYSVPNIQRSLLMGSPVNGSIVVKALGRTSVGKKIFGKSFHVLSGGLQSICKHKVGVIAGTGGKGLGQFFVDLPKPHDGAVSVSETQLAGAIDSISLPVSHFSMLFSQQVISAIDEFLQYGQFRLKKVRPD